MSETHEITFQLTCDASNSLLSNANRLLKVQNEMYEHNVVMKIADKPCENGDRYISLKGSSEESLRAAKHYLTNMQLSNHRSMADVVREVMHSNGIRVSNSVGEIYLFPITKLTDVGFYSKGPRNEETFMTPAQMRISSNPSNENLHGFSPEENTVHSESRERIKYNEIIANDELVLKDVSRRKLEDRRSEAFMRAGPRATLHFIPTEVKACIVTCGGLCPGLNNVIRELVRALSFLYGVKDITGIVGGYNGFHMENWPKGFGPIALTPAIVHDIHHKGNNSSFGKYHSYPNCISGL
jgi:hypothetical protein